MKKRRKRRKSLGDASGIIPAITYLIGGGSAPGNKPGSGLPVSVTFDITDKIKETMIITGGVIAAGTILNAVIGRI